MRPILVNVGLVPVLIVAIPLILLLSIAPHGGRIRRFRRRALDWLDKITNDNGAELIYLACPSGGDDGTKTSKDLSRVPTDHAAVQTKLIIVPARRSAMRGPTT